ncbi:type-F conjugative transfer system pilin assembly thiol-disulfide isomerase TrbB [Escherichia coli]|uniref:type-F conjugative transfer system pilin assembly thiol-disulfide isomerase TrbB n=1 Tax=Escherichia coli TaxID=562 RepID=UPI00403FA5E6
MSLTNLLPVILLMMATGVQASTRDEIERLWNPQGMAAQPAQPAADTSARTEKPAPRWFRLSNGRQVNLADWKVVLFMQGHCPYCHQFDPVLKQLAQQYGFSVFPYTLDGQGDTAFPEALPVPPDVMQTFFPNIPVKAITRSESYLCAMKAGACRYDTEGYVTEHISQEEEAYAAARLDKIRRQNRIKAELQAVLDEK